APAAGPAGPAMVEAPPLDRLRASPPLAADAAAIVVLRPGIVLIWEGETAWQARRRLWGEPYRACPGIRLLLDHVRLDCRRRRAAWAPAPARPRPIISHDAGSGTAAWTLASRTTSFGNPAGLARGAAGCHGQDTRATGLDVVFRQRGAA